MDASVLLWYLTEFSIEGALEAVNSASIVLWSLLNSSECQSCMRFGIGKCWKSGW